MIFRALLYLNIFLLFFINEQLRAQIVFKNPPAYKIKATDSVFFDLSPTRKILSLNGAWNVYKSEEEGKAQVNVPSVFEGEGELTFERNFALTKDEIDNHTLTLNFLGLNYTADIEINGTSIYRHSGGEFPFKLDLPKDILRDDKSNLLKVKLYYDPDAENTIPVKQRFLYPNGMGGILRDAYIHLAPNVSISDVNLFYKYNAGSNRAQISLTSNIDNREFRKSADTAAVGNNFVLRVQVSSPAGSAAIQETSFQLLPNKSKQISQSIDLSAPIVWSPSSPQSYSITIEIWRDGNLVDRSRRSAAIYNLTTEGDSLRLNGSGYKINGVTYIPSSYEYGSLLTYEQMENDIRIIKETGFNSVRFSKSVPHPYYLELCEKYGLLAIIETPISSVPTGITTDQNFIARSRSYLGNFLKAYKRYTAVAGIGIGSSFLPTEDGHINFIQNMGALIKKESKALTFASFAGINIHKIENIDLYGVEFYNNSIYEQEVKLNELADRLGAASVFVSSASYSAFAGNSDGYLNPHTFEAQAKFFEDVIEYSENNKIAGFFINTMFDYRGEFASLTAGYNEDNLYLLGIAGEDRSINRLGYDVVRAKLHNTEKVTIPIGSKKDDAPMVFIIFGIVLAILVGILVNSGRKFREDSSRALLRPYNFYADVRDQRIMSSFHTSFLAVVVAMTSALLLANLLYYFKENILFERMLLAFGSHTIISSVSYLAWHPIYALAWLTAVSGVFLIILTLLVKAGSFFVRNRVFLSSVYFSVIWSFLPLILLIPLGIVLYRILSSDVANVYVFSALIVFTLWIFYRLMKGIYVIFDVNAGSVYFYSILLVLVLFGSLIFYYEVQNSVLDYLLLSFKQHNIFG